MDDKLQKLLNLEKDAEAKRWSIDKKIYEMLNSAIDSEIRRVGECLITDLSLTQDNEITLTTEYNDVYKIKIELQ